MFKNKKVILAFLVFFILFFSFFNVSKATSNTITLVANISNYKGTELVFADFSNLVDPSTGAYIITSHNGKYNIYICPVEGATCYTPSYNCDFYWLDSEGNKVTLNNYYYTGSEWVFSRNINRTEGNWKETYYCSVDMYNENGTLFFQSAPQEVAPQMVLAPIVEEMEMEVTLKEIIQILPLIIVIVVSFLGLRKALQMLLSLLHRCLII